MKKFILVLIASILSCGLTLAGYVFFFETNKPHEIVESYALTTTAVSELNSLNSIEETVNFTSAAEKNFTNSSTCEKHNVKQRLYKL
jgi:hypothetical protein